METLQFSEQDTPPLARDIYPPKHIARILFSDAVTAGDVSLTEAAGDPDAQVYASVHLKRADLPEVSFASVPQDFSGDERQLLALLDPADHAPILQIRDESVSEAAFQEVCAQRHVWWLPATGDKDEYAWLDTARLHNVGVMQIGDAPFIVNDFSGTVDMPAFLKSIEALTRGLLLQGMNVTECFTAINVRTDDYSDFAVAAQALAGYKGRNVPEPETPVDITITTPSPDQFDPFVYLPKDITYRLRFLIV